ncbi:Ppx/GppA phosphatase family protein [Hydrogenovibrio kuenenii]|uniref:Ppx/GppA phosphatase family protein n=1 Tax=Hydrogenovibrio kuenenii TaxID=63658 RepID=UPI00046631F1|nr:phosphatase [Hydrogenovibrio kuenenii]
MSEKDALKANSPLNTATDAATENDASDAQLYAAIDLGSNSFHMIIARDVDGQMQVVDKHKEMVRLRGGLDENGYLDEVAFNNAIACLERFGQLLKGFPEGHVRAVGTNTLRNARNSKDFLKRAKEVLGHEIQIIAGQEEARLIYLGVSHGLPSSDEQRLVMDIGGGSTEYIIGVGFEQRHLTSTEMGCVSITQRFFKNDEVSERDMLNAINTCRLILRPHHMNLTRLGWETAIGASGSIKSIGTLLKENDWTDGDITLDGMLKLKAFLVEHETISQAIEAGLKGLKSERIPVLSGGLAILIATFLELGIDSMQVSANALREGLIFDTLGRLYEADVRETTVANMQNWLKIDTTQAQKVANTAVNFYQQIHKQWNLDDDSYDYPKLLKWAAQLHEAGIAISYKRYRHHSAYLVENSELAGFTQQEKIMLTAMLLNHRGKFFKEPFEALPAPHNDKLINLTVLLRLAVRIHRGRDMEAANIELSLIDNSELNLVFEPDWLVQHPLTQLDLEIEAERLKAMDFTLTFE